MEIIIESQIGKTKGDKFLIVLILELYYFVRRYSQNLSENYKEIRSMSVFSEFNFNYNQAIHPFVLYSLLIPVVIIILVWSFLYFELGLLLGVLYFIFIIIVLIASMLIMSLKFIIDTLISSYCYFLSFIITSISAFSDFIKMLKRII